jgi:hypothetical protein
MGDVEMAEELMVLRKENERLRREVELLTHCVSKESLKEVNEALSAEGE